jgi:hypothetical protein
VRAAVAFGNVSGTDFNADDTGATFDATVTKPTATVNGTLQLIIGAINSQAAGTHLITSSADETVNRSDNSATLFTSAIIWRAGLTADGATVDYNHSNAASATKSAMVMVLTGHDTGTPIRVAGCNTGNGTAPVSPDTTAATNGDMVVRTLVWHDDGDNQTITHPGSHTSIAADYKPAAANGKGIAVSFATSAGGTPGTATWGIPSARDFVACTVVVATTGGASSGLLLRRRRS